MTDAATPPPAPAPAARELKGFRGWLLLLAVGVCLGPLRLLVELARSWDGYQAIAKLPNGPIALVGESLLNFVIFGLQIVVIVAMLGRRRSFPKLFTWLWVASIASQIADTILILSLFPQYASAAFGPEFGRSLASLVAVGLWVWYVHVSVRVANTFTN